VLAAIRESAPDLLPRRSPTIFVSLLNHSKVGECGLERVRTFNSGGAPWSAGRDRRIRAPDSGAPLNEGYGLSETSPVTHSTPQLSIPEARDDRPAGVRHRHESGRRRNRNAGTANRRGRRALHLGPAGDERGTGPSRTRAPPCSAPAPDGRIWFHTGDIARDRPRMASPRSSSARKTSSSSTGSTCTRRTSSRCSTRIRPCGSRR